MKRHPSAVAREQRAMTQARSASRRHRASEIPDARDDEPTPRPRPPGRSNWFRVMKAAAHGWEQIGTAPTYCEALALVPNIMTPGRYVVFSPSGKNMFDTRG